MELRAGAQEAFQAGNPDTKVALVFAMWNRRDTLRIDLTREFAPEASPGLPTGLTLVAPQSVPRRTPFTPRGHAALMHSITHIEFNAINLALDAAWRFAGMPESYYLDWLQVAHEEARHFTALNSHLNANGYAYGDFQAHEGLWNICEHTRHDIVARMALVPRTMEARGLDATPMIQAKLARVGSPQAQEAIAILDVILREEIGHVATGNRWYRWLCERQGLDANAFYAQAALLHRAPTPRPPFNMPARKAAGFTDDELAALERISTAA